MVAHPKFSSDTSISSIRTGEFISLKEDKSIALKTVLDWKYVFILLLTGNGKKWSSVQVQSGRLSFHSPLSLHSPDMVFLHVLSPFNQPDLPQTLSAITSLLSNIKPLFSLLSAIISGYRATIPLQLFIQWLPPRQQISRICLPPSPQPVSRLKYYFITMESSGQTFFCTRGNKSSCSLIKMNKSLLIELVLPTGSTGGGALLMSIRLVEVSPWHTLIGRLFFGSSCPFQISF